MTGHRTIYPSYYDWMVAISRVARLDIKGEHAIVRLVAIEHSRQVKGHGRVLNALIEREAKASGVKTLFVNAAPTAVGYYDKAGWERFTWDASELASIASDACRCANDWINLCKCYAADGISETTYVEATLRRVNTYELHETPVGVLMELVE